MRDQARLQLSYTRIVTPIDGVFGERAVHVGNYVNPGSRLLSVVPLANAYVVGNFQEIQLTHVSVGQAVQLRVDTYPDEVLKAHVHSIAPATGVTFAAVRPDNATGNFTKVVQRIPVKIILDPGQPLVARLNKKWVPCESRHCNERSDVVDEPVGLPGRSGFPAPAKQ